MPPSSAPINHPYLVRSDGTMGLPNNHTNFRVGCCHPAAVASVLRLVDAMFYDHFVLALVRRTGITSPVVIFVIAR